MPIPKPPSKIVGVSTPLFGMCWYADPSNNGTSIIAYCGGGGSAATGVRNFVIIKFGLLDDDNTCSSPAAAAARQQQDTTTTTTPTTTDENKTVIVKTGDQVGVAVTIAKNPTTNKLSLFCALGSKIHVYSLLLLHDEPKLEQELSVGDNVNAIAVNAMVNQIVVGCESGTIKIYDIINDYQINELATHTCEGHGKAVCSVAFAPRSNWIVSSGKDGTARVWNNNVCISVLSCTITDPKSPKPPLPPKRGGQQQQQSILVRGCGFGDLEGKLVFTVASGRKGKAFLSKWGYDETQKQYLCIERTECSLFPISAMSIAMDATFIALGATNGNVILWNIEKWKPIKVFKEVHDLPVTCIAARPYDLPLKGEEEIGIRFNALSASADSQLAWLTTQRKIPKNATARKVSSSGTPVAKYTNRLVILALIYYCILSPVFKEIVDKCGGDDVHGLVLKLQCIRDDVLIAPMSRPGIAVPPH